MNLDVLTEAAGLVTEAREPGPLSYTGTYSLGTGDNVTFKFAQNLGDRKEHVEKLTVNGEQMTMTDSDGTTVTFKKIN